MHEAFAARFRLQRERWEERVAEGGFGELQPLELLLLILLLELLLRETRRRARLIGEKH